MSADPRLLAGLGDPKEEFVKTDDEEADGMCRGKGGCGISGRQGLPKENFERFSWVGLLSRVRWWSF